MSAHRRRGRPDGTSAHPSAIALPSGPAAGDEADPNPSSAAFEPSFPIVEAKLHPPVRRPGTIGRTRVLRLLDDAADTPIISVIAPPGYGKTVALAEWVGLQDRPVAWLTLDDFDNVPSVLLAYLAVAIDRIHPIGPAARDAIVAPGSRILGAAVPHLASALHRIGRPALLVLDDVHRLHDPTCLDALAALLDHLPPGFQLAILSRSVPDLPLARLRADRRLLEIGQLDLALDASETQELTAAAGHRLAGDQARDLALRTEGWAAAIYLATLAGRRSDAAAPGSGVSGRDAYIADYLRTELLDHASDEDRRFLTRTSILEVVEAPVAEAVTGQAGAAERLRSLARRNHLILEPGGSGEVYRYHKLLRDFLQAELERGDPGAGREIHALAAGWYAAHGRRELAVEHALHGDAAAAARLVTASILPSLFRGHADKLDRWLATFEEPDFRGHPPLAVTGAWIHLLSGRPRAAEILADIAEAAAFKGDPGDGSASFDSSRAILRAVMARRGAGPLLEDAGAAVAGEPTASPWRTVALLMLATAHLAQGDRTAAGDALTAAIDAGAVGGATVAWGLRASLAIERGDWGAAEASARESHAIVAKAKLGHLLPALITFAVAARVAAHRGRVAAAREELVRAQLVRPLASEAAPVVSVVALLELCRAYLALSDTTGARSVLTEAQAILRRRPDLGVLGDQVQVLRDQLSRAAGTLPGSSALTAAELRLLPVLSTPLTFREIGDRLFLSHHTVKTHAISIYGKLQASSRSEAIERAIEIGLLEPFPALPPRRPPEQ